MKDILNLSSNNGIFASESNQMVESSSLLIRKIYFNGGSSGSDKPDAVPRKGVQARWVRAGKVQGIAPGEVRGRMRSVIEASAYLNSPVDKEELKNIKEYAQWKAKKRAYDSGRYNPGEHGGE